MFVVGGVFERDDIFVGVTRQVLPLLVFPAALYAMRLYLCLLNNEVRIIKAKKANKASITVFAGNS